MKKRWLALAVVVPALLGPAPPASAAAPDPGKIACTQTGSSPHGTTFEVAGEPAPTFVHRWHAGPARAALCFRGEGFAGTSVRASWTTPWLVRTGGYAFQFTYDFANLDPAGDVSYLFELRERDRGTAWSTWWRPTARSQGPVDGEGGGYGVGVAIDCIGPCRPQHMMWQLRLTVRFSAPAAIDMNVSAHA